MVKPRAARKKPIVVSSGSDEEPHSPPAKRPKRGTLLSVANGDSGADTKLTSTRSGRASSSKTSSSSTKKPPASSPAKPKAASKQITSFFSAASRPQFSQPTPSPEKPASSANVDLDDIFDSSDEERSKGKPTALPVRRGKQFATDHGAGLKGSQRFLTSLEGRAVSPAPPHGPAIDTIDRRPWTEKYGPASLDELAVHKKKVSDVRTWLTDVFNGTNRKRLLLLKGPAGSGKTTTISLLAKDMEFHTHEWKNPESTAASPEGGFVSVTAQFEDFVGRSGTFGSLAFDGPAAASRIPTAPVKTSREKQLILVEEFPNTFTRTSSTLQSFRTSVMNYLAATTPSATAFFSRTGDSPPSVTPIVMIVSETLLSTNTAAADSFTAHRLLGPEILGHPGVTVIEFNPIATTFMTKALDQIVIKEARKSGRKKTVGPQVIQRLTELGDIRSAVSSLEFLCLRGDDAEGWGANINFSKKKTSKDTPITRMEQESLEIVTQRESTLGIFHAVGRVVYNKRLAEDANRPAPQPPNYFPDRRRPKVSEVNIDTLIDELGTDTQTFVAALHENYVLSCDAGDSEETLDCVNGSIDALSDSDLLSPDRFGTSSFGRRNYQVSSSDTLRQDEMSFQASVRGLLYNLPSPVKRIAPPPGIMGSKQKSVGFSGAPAKGNAYVMYYPSSLRLWRQQEEIGALLELWISRAQRGDLFSALGATPTPSATVTGGVDTWRKSAPSAQPPRSTASASEQKTQEDTQTVVLLGSGGSARNEMLLERLPYLPAILHKKSRTSSTTSTAIREIRKITAFTGSNVSASTEDDDVEERDEPAEGEQWATDKPTPDTPRKKKRIGIESKKKETDSAIPGGDAAGKNLVLSDDDIED